MLLMVCGICFLSFFVINTINCCTFVVNANSIFGTGPAYIIVAMLWYVPTFSVLTSTSRSIDNYSMIDSKILLESVAG